MKNTNVFLALVIAGIALLGACTSAPKAAPVTPVTPETLRDAGVDTAAPGAESEAYLRLISSSETGTYGPVLIFIERHNSRLVQAEIALGMYRLSKSAGLNRIGREGMFEGETFEGRELPLVPGVDSRLIALNLLEEGVFTASEFMFLTEGSDVFGIEKENEYNMPMPEQWDIAYDNYLLAGIIADVGWEKVQPLVHIINTSTNEEQRTAAYTALLELSPWIKETEAVFEEYSADVIIKRLMELREKGDSIRGQQPFDNNGGDITIINNSLRESFTGLVRFYENVRQRSFTMAANVLERLKRENGPLAIVIGANHTREVEDYFKKEGVRYYTLEPRTLWSTSDPSNLSDEAYERRSNGKPVSESAAFRTFLGIDVMLRSLLLELFTAKQAATEGLILAALNDSVLHAGQAPSVEMDVLTANGIQVIDRETLPDGSVMAALVSEGRRVYFRAIPGEGFNPAEIAALPDMETALQEMIERLEMTPIGSPYDPPVTAFNIPAAKVVCVISPDPEVIRAINLKTTS